MLLAAAGPPCERREAERKGHHMLQHLPNPAESSPWFPKEQQVEGRYVHIDI